MHLSCTMFSLESLIQGNWLSHADARYLLPYGWACYISVRCHCGFRQLHWGLTADEGLVVSAGHEAPGVDSRSWLSTVSFPDDPWREWATSVWNPFPALWVKQKPSTSEQTAAR